MYKERYVNGVKDGEEQIEYSLLDQNGSYSPVSSATYTMFGEELGQLKRQGIL